MSRCQKIIIFLVISFIAIMYWLQLPPSVTTIRFEGKLELTPIPTNEPTNTIAPTPIQPSTLEPEWADGKSVEMGGIRDEAERKIAYYFCKKYHLPACGYEHSFISAAERNNLPWFLLPALAMVESTGCKFMAGNNCFGFGDGSYYYHFSSIADGIDYVADALGGKGKDGHYYAGKTIEEKLKKYNPHAGYYEKVMSVMREIEGSYSKNSNN